MSNKIKKSKLKINSAEAFSILTTPEKPSFIEMESRDSLKVALLLKKEQRANELFLKSNFSEIKEQLAKLKPELKSKIIAHYKKYFWLHYGYEGPILELDYFLEIWQGLLRQGRLEDFIKESKNKFIEIKNKRALLFRQLKFNQKEKRLFNLAKAIVWLKAYRKDASYFGLYVLDKIAQEIGKRLNLSLRQVRFFCDWEIKEALLKDEYDVEELNQRYNYSIIYTDSERRPLIHSGKRAKKFLEKKRFVEFKAREISELSGVCACPGQAKGIVKIIETIDDIRKMKKGDILLSETTYPALVPAMKLTGAIVTNIGGLTCHAAIVSREMRIPCIVGTKIATKVLKDGDLVEVDATKGVVRIIRKR